MPILLEQTHIKNIQQPKPAQYTYIYIYMARTDINNNHHASHMSTWFKFKCKRKLYEKQTGFSCVIYENKTQNISRSRESNKYAARKQMHASKIAKKY